MSKQHSQKRKARITPPPSPPAPSTPGHRLTAFQGSSCIPGTAPEPPLPPGTSQYFWEDTQTPQGCGCGGCSGRGAGAQVSIPGVGLAFHLSTLPTLGRGEEGP